MQVPVRDLDGEAEGERELPEAFETPVRPELIRRAVHAAQANRTQDYGTDEYAGLRTPAESFGSGRGQAHVPRQNGVGKRVPHATGGRASHGPTTDTDRTKSINDKERKLAVRSAVAATADPELVEERGHVFDDDIDLPIVLDDEFEDLEKTQDALAAFEALGLAGDVERADETSVKAGRGTTRGRGRRRPTAVLVVTSEEPSRAARNLAGVDVTTGREVDAEDLAPGGQPGRLTVWTQSALEEVAER
ncbi:50S ribosomal protein L4 [Halococcoides cellulosivorans]|uniref:Large ribosomal subunit protein uL4 n=1 Tax=Halococcoides cellulosivorans TaxID=1679096 RepID=A0A2R4X2F6_9EURY|nr:50S ribosomal protein L4 [Halococcoides cellulosivorans]AWB27903.1 50S ribosomal protein L4 [Halococcoides cellulosivorans]